MSRVGKQPITLPQGVQVTVAGAVVTAKGPKGTLSVTLCDGINASVEGSAIQVKRSSDSLQHKALHGTSRALISNLVEGVTKGYARSLEIVGVGYKATLQGKKIALNVGFANIIEIAIPDGITVVVPDPSHVNVSGIDKALVGQVAAAIRAARKPEPYKGKGVRYLGEVVRKKAGKAAAGAGKK